LKHAGHRAASKAKANERVANDVAHLIAQAVTLHNAGSHLPAQTLCEKVLQRQADHFDALHLMGASKFATQEFFEAERLLKRAVALQPRSAAAHYHLGLAQFALKQFNAARASCELALTVQPNFPLALNNLGNALNELDELEHAVACYSRAVAYKPDYAEAFYNRGAVLSRLDRFAEALTSFDRAIALQPTHALALDTRGVALIELRRFDDAIASVERALAIKPDFANAYAHRGRALASLGQFDRAIADYEKALSLSPDLEVALLGLTTAFLLTHRLADASATVLRALAVAPDSAHVIAIAGQCCARSGDVEGAIRHFDRALALKPNLTHLITEKIFVLDAAPWAGTVEHQQIRREWWDRIGSKVAPQSPVSYPNDRDPARRIVLGYVSSDFRNHSAALCFGEVLRNHDHSAFEVVCYSCSPIRDSMTEELERSADKWVDAAHLTDEELADRIRADRIDILIDLSGHTAGNRLAVFARKPAPVAVSGFGSGSGTGLPTVEYLFADPVSTPPEVRHLYPERIHDLPCLTTLAAPPAECRTAEPPCLARGHVTFGIFNRIEKISENNFPVWSRILSAVPGARLVLKHFALADPALAHQMVERFVAHGVAAERITCLGQTTRGEHLAAYAGVDICLDPFPYNGGASTWEALHMGVPVVAMLGNRSSSRAAAAILSSIGLTDWIASDEAAYVDVAAGHAAQGELLRRLRRGLPDRIANSAAGDTARYTRAVEQAYRGFWNAYCACADATS
jgi:predicted O-linked N-acetylglucosamine transferase (SPINDLY family)